MAILYAVRYVGDEGIGVAAVCAGKGSLVGFDGSDGHYRGTYAEQNGRFFGKIVLTSDEHWPLVTGGTIGAGESIEMAFDLPKDFANGEPQEIYLNGQPVKLTIKKIGEIA